MTVLLSYLYFTQIFPLHNVTDFYIYVLILYNNADDQTYQTLTLPKGSRFAVS